MSEEQAIETEDEIETSAEETIVESEEAEEVEIVLEGEEQPPSIPLPALHKRLGREKRKTEAANTAAEEERRRAEMLEEENKLLRLQAQQTQTAKRPDEDDFETKAEYLTALEKYEDERITKAAQAQAEKIIQQTQAVNTQTASKANLNQQINAHYERSAKLKVPDYSETEAIAADILGDEVAEQIVANTEESHLVMYHLGKNPAKAEKIKALIESNPLKGVMEIGRLSSSLKIKPKTKLAPDPETEVDGGLPSYDERGPQGATFS